MHGWCRWHVASRIYIAWVSEAEGEGERTNLESGSFSPTKWHNDRFRSVQLKFQAQRNISSALSSASVVAPAIPRLTSTDFTHASDWFEELQCSLLVGGRRWKP